MMLFISHASEDRDDFVRPLAEALTAEFEKVWYCEYELRLGDSLLEKIDQGVASCDFGIVVLSKHFFEKKWPRAELEGLFARETRSGKIILPIWKDITEDEVKAHSPILASKVAISTTAGLPKVLEAIRLAVDVSKRQKKLTAVDVARQRVETLKQTVVEHQRSEQLLRNCQGAILVSGNIETVWETIENVLSADSGPPVTPKFQCARPVPTSMNVSGVDGMHLNLHAANLSSNYAADTKLEIKIFRQQWDDLGRAISELQIQFQTDFQPAFRSGDEVVWVSADKAAMYTAEALAAYLIELYADHVQKQITGRR